MCGGGGSRRRQQIRLEIRETIIEARDEREKRESPSIRKIEAGWEAGNRPRASSQAGSEVDCSRKLHFSQRLSTYYLIINFSTSALFSCFQFSS